MLAAIAKPFRRTLVAASLAFLACVAPTGAASAQLAWEPDTDRMGQDLRGFDLPAADPLLCREACDRDPACRSWTYVKPDTRQGPRPRCWLKSAVPPARADACCVSGVKPAAAAAGSCFRDAAARDLDRFETQGPDMTPQKCISTCRDGGFAFAGTQFSSQCFCANGYGRYGPADNCTMRCSGDANQVCGGSWANNVYEVASGRPVPPGSSVQPPSNAPAGALGCFRDRPDRDLAGFETSAADMTLQKCVATCAGRGFPFAGAQFASQCFCGNGYGRHGPAPNCNMKCSGNPDQTCGGEWANSVFVTGLAAAAAPWQDPATRTLIDEWLRQVERCTRGPHPGSYIDPWARICGRLATVTADCSQTPDHPAGWTSDQYVWTNNWCHDYYPVRVQDYVRRRSSGTPAPAMAQCKAAGAPCW